MRGNQRNGPALETVHLGGRALNPPWATAMERDAGRPALAWLTRQPTPGSRVGCQAQWVACGDGAAARCRRAQPPGLIRIFNRYCGDTSSLVALAKAAGLAWRRLWPPLRLFLPGAVRKCPARGSVPGAVTAAGGEPAGLRSEPVPLAGPGQGGIRIRPPRRLRLPRRARAPRMCCGSMCFGGRCTPRSCGWAVVGAELGWRPARCPLRPFSPPAERGCSGRAGVASGAVLHPRVA